MPSVSLPSIAAVSAIAGVAGAGVAAYGSIESGKASSEAAQYNAEVAQQNQTIAKQNATTAIQAGEEQTAQASQKTRAQVGAIQAAQAASGIDVNSGTAVDVRSSAASLGELNALTVRSNAAQQAYGYQTQDVSEADQAALDESQAQNASEAGEIGAGSSILGGLSSAGAQYNNFLTKNTPISTSGS